MKNKKNILTLQEYLNKTFLNKEEVKEIDTCHLVDKVKGEDLDLSEYPNLERIKIAGIDELRTKLTRLKLGSKPRLKELYCPSHKFTNLDLSGCYNLEMVNCSGNKLKKLDISQLRNLVKLDCEGNKLKELDIQNCENLKELDCSNNLLTELALSKEVNQKIETLRLRNNNFPAQDLSFLAHLVNLKKLWIDNINNNSREEDNSSEKMKRGVYNRFTGSLEYLKNMSKLIDLRFSNTDIDSGLEHLPKSLQRLECEADFREDAGARVIKKELEKYGKSRRSDNFIHLLPSWREFATSPAQKWLNNEYPKDGYCRGEFDKANKGKSRAEITDLQLFEQLFEQAKIKEVKKGFGLKGALELEGFTALKTLDCSNNRLTNLNLKWCENLIELNIFDNEFHTLDFLKHTRRLERLWTSNNQKFSVKSLEFLSPLASLKELDISDSNLRGSLSSLKNLSKLEKVYISRTNINEGLEWLPENCKELYCDLNYDYKSVEIAKELSGFSESRSVKEESEEEKDNHTKYNLDKWREAKANNLLASIIPSERLFVIRSNIKKFINKWGKEENKEIKLSNLQTPEQYNKYRHLGGVKWVARLTAVGGGILALTIDPVAGGALAAASPFIDAISSQIEESYYNVQEKKWAEFIDDVEDLLESYHELLGMLDKIKKDNLGEVNKALNELREEADAFLKKYDIKDDNNSGNSKGGNGMVDLSELIEKREEFAKDLANEKEKDESSQLGQIIKGIKKLEEEVIAYRQDSSLLAYKRSLPKANDEKVEEEKLKENLEVPEENDNFFGEFMLGDESSKSIQSEKLNEISQSHLLDDKEKDVKASSKSKNPWLANLNNLKRRVKKIISPQINDSHELQNQELQVQVQIDPK